SPTLPESESELQVDKGPTEPVMPTPTTLSIDLPEAVDLPELNSEAGFEDFSIGKLDCVNEMCHFTLKKPAKSDEQGLFTIEPYAGQPNNWHILHAAVNEDRVLPVARLILNDQQLVFRWLEDAAVA